MPSGTRETVRKALARFAEPWFPGLAGPLTASAWRGLARYGFVPSNYGTHRWLERNPAAERLVLTTIELDGHPEYRIEALPASSRTRYERIGLVFPESISIEPHVAALRKALSFIALVPSLHAAIVAYLQTLHVLQAPGRDFDVTHSDPEVPFSIFVSMPSACPNAALRLAESMVHECMHLQLTMIETLLPLVDNGGEAAFSPWQQRQRPLRGVLHGLYVFSVINGWLHALDHSDLVAPEERTFVAKRRQEIAEEIAQVADLATVEGLTACGQVLVGRLLLRFGLNRFQKVHGHGAERCLRTNSVGEFVTRTFQ